MVAAAPIKVLLVDDDEDDFVNFRDLLSQVTSQKFKIEWAPSFEEGRKALAKGDAEVCFLDYRLGGQTGLDFLREAISSGCKIPMILLTGYGEQEVDLKAMKLGAADYLVKDQVTPLLLERSIRYSIHRAKSLQQILDREAQILVQDRLASVGLLASSLAHEIGTPLGVIRGRAEFLDLKLKNEPEVKKNAEVILSQIDRVSKLIRSLLNLARGDGQEATGAATNLSQVVSEVVDLMGHEFQRGEITLQNTLPPSVLVKASSGPLHQVFLNLLVNSVHAIQSAKKMGRGGHVIRISGEDLGERWAISVADTGCGISEANMKNLFKPFFTTKDIGAGTGLGLATSYRIIESWGGSISVKSTENESTEFRIILPKA